MGQHEGLAEDLAFILSDPSHPRFCQTISGADNNLKASHGVCNLLEEGSDGAFSLEQCRLDYCNKGLEGYEEFISISIKTFHTHSRTMGIAALIFLVLLVCQLWNMHLIKKASLAEAEQKAREERWKKGAAREAPVRGE